MIGRLPLILASLLVGLAVMPARGERGASPAGEEPIGPVDFCLDVIPALTKAGCNAGSCHGSFKGRGGFRLSLWGFDPAADYDALVKQSRGRRVSPAAPLQSLILRKPTARIPHGGGVVLAGDSPTYRILRAWLEEGAPGPAADGPKIERIDVSPDDLVLESGQAAAIHVHAFWSDGSNRDMTQWALFDSGDAAIAEVSKLGEVRAAGQGRTAITVRYLGQVAAVTVTIPYDRIASFPETLHVNYIDDLVQAEWQKVGVLPAPRCDDATFLRRASLDLIGTLPTVEQVRDFCASTDPQKRSKLVDMLLERAEYVDFWALRWSDLLRAHRRFLGDKGLESFQGWLRGQIRDNVPVDAMVRSLLTARGNLYTNGPVAFYFVDKTPPELAETAAQLFLGVRMQCARCHHHPFEVWSQDEYYGMAAFFARVGRKPGLLQFEERIYHQVGMATASNPKNGQAVPPTGLDAKPAQLSPEDDPRHALVDWMAAPENKFFAPALVNRYWKHFFGRGIVDPEDDMRVTNPASNPELLDKLAQKFIASKFDLKDLIRTICRSNIYQLSAEPNDYNRSDKQNYSRYYPKRLNAEVLLDAINVVTNSNTGFGGLPAGTRAVQLPDSAGMTYFLTVFGKPQGESACESERSSEANLAQSLHLLNSSEVQGKLSDGNGRARQLAADAKRSDAEKINELYLWVFSRPPMDKEKQVALAHIQKHEKQKVIAYEDILWALLNTKEFLFNH